MKSWVGVLILSAGLLSCARNAAPPESEPPPQKSPPEVGERGHDDASTTVTLDAHVLADLRITTAPVESRPAGESAPVMGDVQVDERTYAEIGPPVAARTVRLFAAVGQKVRPGQPLAELQSAELGKSRGEWREAQARRELARRAAERKRALAQERIASRREVEEAEAALEAAEADVAAARSSIEALGGGTSQTGGLYRVSSPVAGTVIERTAVVGQVADPARPLFKVADLSTLWINAHAYERDALRVKPGMDVRVAFPALPGQGFTGRLALVGSQVDASSRTIPVRIVLGNPTGLLRPGMAAKVWLPLGDATSHVVTVPAASVQRLGEQWCVFLPRETGTFEARAVGRGRDLGGEVEILTGLRAGETIVVDGAFLLKAEAAKARGAGDSHEH